MENNVACRVKGMGHVTLKFENEYIHILERVRYVPKFNKNLISMGDLDDIGLEVRIGNGTLKVRFACDFQRYKKERYLCHKGYCSLAWSCRGF